MLADWIGLVADLTDVARLATALSPSASGSFTGWHSRVCLDAALLPAAIPPRSR